MVHFPIDPLSHSRLSTYLQCGWKGYMTYDKGFESGLLASYNIQGTVVHQAIEKLHKGYNPWQLGKKKSIKQIHIILDSIWAGLLGGKQEVQFLKEYSILLDEMYASCKRQQEKMTGRPCKAPWMTKLWHQQYKSALINKERILTMIMRRLNYVEFEPLSTVFNNSYLFTSNYCELIDQKFNEPEELHIEYQGNPLHVFEGHYREDIAGINEMASILDKQYSFSFRGAIDQIWISKTGNSIYIFDVKTSRTPVTPDKVKYHDQLFLYATAINEKMGRVARVGIIDVREKSLTDYKPDVTDYNKFIDKYTTKLAMYDIIKITGLYMPASGSPMNLCNHCPIGNHRACKWYKPTEIPYTPNQ